MILFGLGDTNGDFTACGHGEAGTLDLFEGVISVVRAVFSSALVYVTVCAAAHFAALIIE